MGAETPAKRKYELHKRAEAVAETRRRITEAAVELHGTVGPARTTISGVAERAGVQRHTVYRHFPRDDDLLAACSGHWAAQNPLPDADPWRTVADPGERVREALGELYAYYERTAYMLEHVYRDAPVVPGLAPGLREFQRDLESKSDVLAAAFGARRRRRLVAAAVRHAVDFRTWLLLTRDQGLGRRQAVELMATLVESAAER